MPASSFLQSKHKYPPAIHEAVWSSTASQTSNTSALRKYKSIKQFQHPHFLEYSFSVKYPQYVEKQFIKQQRGKTNFPTLFACRPQVKTFCHTENFKKQKFSKGFLTCQYSESSIWGSNCGGSYINRPVGTHFYLGSSGKI